MQIGARIYYDVETGDIILNTGESAWNVTQLTPAQERERFSVLNERVESTYDYIQLDYGQYRQDFAECNGYRVNPVTKTLEFSYPDPNDPPAEPMYQPPLTEQVAIQQSQIDALTMEILVMKGLV